MTLMRATEISVHDGAMQLVEPLSITLEAGQPLVILGETGSGKSLFAQAIMGTLPESLSARGEVEIAGRRISAARPRDFRSLWGRQIAVLPQEPWLSLDPLMPAECQVGEVHHLVRGLGRSEARARTAADLTAMGLGVAGAKLPHELSGGMAQRVAIAAARAGGAQIVIADEPTKGLDAARRDDVAEMLMAEVGAGGGLIVITHDLAFARRIGGQLIVLRKGRVVETGVTADVFAAPTSDYTARLIAADPETWQARKPTPRGDSVLRGEGLAVSRGQRELFRDVSLDIAQGQVFGVTGPSGCGKSTLGDVLLGLHRPSAGRVERNVARATAFQKLYQDPVAAFPQHQSLHRTLSDVARRHGEDPKQIDANLDHLALSPALLSRKPGEVSGGELQRLAILRLLLVRPAFIFADEPTSRLDPITQADVIHLLVDTAERDGCAVMLVSHDPALVAKTADHVLDLTTASYSANGAMEAAMAQ
jgi:ABC-type glutathione transport system ATPase component